LLFNDEPNNKTLSEKKNPYFLKRKRKFKGRNPIFYLFIIILLLEMYYFN